MALRAARRTNSPPVDPLALFTREDAVVDADEAKLTSFVQEVVKIILSARGLRCWVKYRCPVAALLEHIRNGNSAAAAGPGREREDYETGV